jgi:hypothetical protein
MLDEMRHSMLRPPSLALLMFAGVLAGCASMSAPEPTPTPAIATPVVQEQVVRAIQSGPGFLNYCPTVPGRAPARYDVDLPGTSRASGWCQTEVKRGPQFDIVTFHAHWNATDQIGKQGTLMLRYQVTRPSVTVPTPVALLTGQSGQLPP